MNKFINTQAGNTVEELDLPVDGSTLVNGLLPIPDGAQILVHWDKDDNFVFYKGDEGYMAGDTEWGWTLSEESVGTLRAGEHKGAVIIWDGENYVEDTSSTFQA